MKKIITAVILMMVGLTAFAAEFRYRDDDGKLVTKIEQKKLTNAYYNDFVQFLMYGKDGKTMVSDYVVRPEKPVEKGFLMTGINAEIYLDGLEKALLMMSFKKEYRAYCEELMNKTIKIIEDQWK